MRVVAGSPGNPLAIEKHAQAAGMALFFVHEQSVGRDVFKIAAPPGLNDS